MVDRCEMSSSVSLPIPLNMIQYSKLFLRKKGVTGGHQWSMIKGLFTIFCVAPLVRVYRLRKSLTSMSLM